MPGGDFPAWVAVTVREKIPHACSTVVDCDGVVRVDVFTASEAFTATAAQTYTGTEASAGFCRLPLSWNWPSVPLRIRGLPAGSLGS